MGQDNDYFNNDVDKDSNFTHETSPVKHPHNVANIRLQNDGDHIAISNEYKIPMKTTPSGRGRAAVQAVQKSPAMQGTLGSLTNPDSEYH